MSTDAVVPSKSALSFVKEMKAENKELDEFDKKDHSLYQLSQTTGWKDLKEYINNLKESLKPQVDMDSSSDDDMFKSYGMRMVMYELTASNLSKIITRVEDATNETERKINKKTK